MMSILRTEVDKWLCQREIGCPPIAGFRNQLHRQLYSAMKCVTCWNPAHTVNHTHHGGIFNFDFSPDGSLLVAACERKSVLMFDPLAGKLIGCKSGAHDDCVNCVRFLDSRTFVTCSDDTTVCLWDSRFLKQKIRTLRGHSNWVKNIEYASDLGLLVTSGFDGSIYAWDINSYSEADNGFTRVFHTNGLMRTKLTPDGTKLVIATAGGYLMVVHDLDLMNLSQDLHGFKPNLYRLMQLGQSPLRNGYTYNHVFSRQRNRVELISDFPSHNEAEMIASLEVHPQGWCVVSRNTSSDETSEWTCVHDIQTDPLRHEDGDNQDHASSTKQCPQTASEPHKRASRKRRSEEMERQDQPDATPHSEAGSREPSRSSSPAFMFSVNVNNSSTSASAHTPSTSRGGSTSIAGEQQDVRSRPESAENSLIGESSVDDNDESAESPNGDRDESRTVSSQDSGRQVADGPGQNVSHSGVMNSVRIGESITFVIRSGSQVVDRTLLFLGHNRTPCDSGPKIQENEARLTHFIEEPNVGRGFIKEVCFSSDGRLICSPFGYGVRLLSFNPECSELCDCVMDRPVTLYEVTTNMSHVSPVLTTKFSPTHSLLVTGCLNGKVDFHQPVL